MDIFYLAAFVAPLVALLERNHRRHGLPQAPWGGVPDRDLERVRHDLSLADHDLRDDGLERGRRESPAEAHPSPAARPLRETTPVVCRAASS